MSEEIKYVSNYGSADLSKEEIAAIEKECKRLKTEQPRIQKTIIDIKVGKRTISGKYINTRKGCEFQITALDNGGKKEEKPETTQGTTDSLTEQINEAIKAKKIKKSGGWYKIGEKSFNGMSNLRKAVKADATLLN